MERSHMPYADFRRGVARALVQRFRASRTDAVKLVKKWNDVILSRWMAGQTTGKVAEHVHKYERQGVVCPCERRLRDCPRHGRHRTARDAENPKPGEVYETRWGNRWMVTGKTPKGRVVVRRWTPRYDGELQWTPAMLAKLKLVRNAEAAAVAKALPPDIRERAFPSGASLIDRIIGRKPGTRTSAEYEQTGLLGIRDPNRRYYVYVIETMKKGKRQFYVGQTGKKPEQRFKEHKAGKHFAYAKGAKLLRKDLTKKLPPLYTRKQAERAEKIIARTLRKRGLSVTGGH